MDVKINAVTKVYRGGITALKDVTLTIPTGMYGLLGPNGAGKTTFMRMLAGILRPTSGSIQVGPYDARTTAGRRSVQRVLGYLPQDLGLYPDLSARELLDYLAILKGLRERTTRRKRVEELLEVVGLTDVAQRAFKALSGGMRRRVGIAQALLGDPQLLIVDEPTAGLDPEERLRFRNLLSMLSGERTVLLSTHIIEDIAQTCQQLAVLKAGQVVFQGSLGTLTHQAQGRVFLVTTDPGKQPQGAMSIVSTLNLGHAVQYRVVGEPALQEKSVAVEPSLEDGYVWLMRHSVRALAQDLPTNHAR